MLAIAKNIMFLLPSSFAGSIRELAAKWLWVSKAKWEAVE